MAREKKFVQDRFEMMDTARQDWQDDWDENYRWLKAEVDRTDDDGNELSRVNVNLAREKSETATQFLCEAFFYTLKFFSLIPREGGDVEAAWVFQETIRYYISRIESLGEFGYKWLMQAMVKGFSPAKIRTTFNAAGKLKGFEFLPCHVNDVWVPSEWAVGAVKDFFFQARVSKEFLEDQEDKKHYNKSEIVRFIDDMKAGTKEEGPEDPRKNEIAEDNKEIPEELHQGKFVIMEYWYFDEIKETWRLQTWGVKDGKVEYAIRPDAESPFWFGHEFIFGLNNPEMYHAAGQGEPLKVSDFQRGINRLVNQELDLNDVALNPVLMVNKHAMASDTDLTPAINRQLGGTVIMDKIGPGNVEFSKPPVQPPNTNTMIGYLEQEGEKASINTRLIRGLGPRTQEPATTTLTMRNQGMKSVNFKAWVIGWALEEMVRKILIALQQFATEEEMIRITGHRGYKFFAVSQHQRKDKSEALYKNETLSLQASKKEALKLYDVEIATDLKESPDVMVKRGIEAVTLFANVPQLAETMNDWKPLSRQLLDGWGFRNTDTMVSYKPKVNPELSEQLAQIPEQEIINFIKTHKFIEGPETAPAEPGGVGRGTHLKSPVSGQAGSQEVATRADAMRADRGG